MSVSFDLIKEQRQQIKKHFFQIQLEKYLESSSHLIFAILIYIALF
jgi:hypothetical protein